jgi:hypothetical protein
VIAGVRPGETGYVTLWFALLRTRADVWAKDAASGRAIYGAPVRVCQLDFISGWSCFTGSTVARGSGAGFNLTAYNGSSLWVAVDPGWRSNRSDGVRLAPSSAPPGVWEGVYNLTVSTEYDYAKGARVAYPVVSAPLNGTFKISLHLEFVRPSDYLSFEARLEVEDPPGSGSYKVVASTKGKGRGTLDYTGTLTLANQRLRVSVVPYNPYSQSSASGWFLIAVKRNGTLNPVGWEVLQGWEPSLPRLRPHLGTVRAGLLRLQLHGSRSIQQRVQPHRPSW